MLRVFRAGFAILCLALLAVGYAASQFAYPDRAAEHARFMDRPAVATAALLIFLIAVALAFIPDPQSEEEEQP